MVSPPRKRRGAHAASAAGLLPAAALGEVGSASTGDEGKDKGIFLMGSLIACIGILTRFKTTSIVFPAVTVCLGSFTVFNKNEKSPK